MGENALGATILGIPATIPYGAAGMLGKLDLTCKTVIFVASFVLWTVLMLLLRNYMKRAVDKMELAWLCDQYDPNLKKRMFCQRDFWAPSPARQRIRHELLEFLKYR